MELTISVSKVKPKKQESDSKFTIGKRYLTPQNKKTMNKVNRIQGKAEKKTALQQALAKESTRYKDQCTALRTKYRTGLKAELDKAKSTHAKKVETIRRSAGSKPKKSTPPKPNAAKPTAK